MWHMLIIVNSIASFKSDYREKHVVVTFITSLASTLNFLNPFSYFHNLSPCVSVYVRAPRLQTSVLHYVTNIDREAVMYPQSTYTTHIQKILSASLLMAESGASLLLLMWVCARARKYELDKNTKDIMLRLSSYRLSKPRITSQWSLWNICCRFHIFVETRCWDPYFRLYDYFVIPQSDNCLLSTCIYLRSLLSQAILFIAL